MKIKNKIIGKDKSVYIIAEIGINHNGDILKALEMVSEAKKSGCDAIKLQVINPEVSYNKDTLSYKVFKDAILSYEELLQIKVLCRKIEIDFLATVGDSISLELMEKVDIDGYKVSSGLMTNYPLIEKLIRLDKPMIFSTGMSEHLEIVELMTFIESFNFHNYSILHCVSQYPSPADVINLQCIKTLEEITSKTVGYSDHYLGDSAVLSAVSLGAKVIEKHFTFDKNNEGADHAISANYEDMAQLVKKIREIENMISDSRERELSEFESKNRNFFRRKLIINKNLKKGNIISLSDLDARRFNNSEIGVSPKEYSFFMGKKLNKDMDKFSLLTKKDLE